MFWSASTRRCKLQHFVVRFTARWPCNAEILSAEHPKIGNHKYNHKQTSNENPPTSITITPPHFFPKVLMKIIENLQKKFSDPKTSETFSIPSPHRPSDCSGGSPGLSPGEVHYDDGSRDYQKYLTVMAKWLHHFVSEKGKRVMFILG
jgi:hypothetical protein